MCIDGLLGEGPHEGGLGEVQAGRRNRCPGFIALQDCLQASILCQSLNTSAFDLHSFSLSLS